MQLTVKLNNKQTKPMTTRKKVLKIKIGFDNSESGFQMSVVKPIQFLNEVAGFETNGSQLATD